MRVKVVFLIQYLILIFIIINKSYGETASIDKFEKYIFDLEKKYNCKIGLSAEAVSTGQVIKYREHEKFQMASVVKLPLAVYIAHLNEKKQLNFEEEISIANENLSPGTGSLYYYTKWKPLKISIKNLMDAMLTLSDNTAADFLFQKVGGPLKVKEYMKNIKLEDINITHDIYQLFLDSNGMKNYKEFKNKPLEYYSKVKSQLSIEDQMKYHDIFHLSDHNSTTPLAMSNLLKMVVNKEILSEDNSELILDMMSRCATSSQSIRRFITSDFRVKDKTGTWFYYVNPKYSYFNNVGIIDLPNSEDKVILSIFVSSDNYTTIKILREVVAIISKTIMDHFYFNNK